MLTVALSLFFGASALWAMIVLWDSVERGLHAAQRIQAELKGLNAAIAHEKMSQKQFGRQALRQPPSSFHMVHKRQSVPLNRQVPKNSATKLLQQLRPASA